MWISKKKFQELKEEIKTNESRRLVTSSAMNIMIEKHEKLLRHLGLSEWTEPATPEKTILITDKDRAKKVKEGKKSYVDPKILQQRAYTEAMRPAQQPFPFGNTFGVLGSGLSR